MAENISNDVNWNAAVNASRTGEFVASTGSEFSPSSDVVSLLALSAALAFMLGVGHCW